MDARPFYKNPALAVRTTEAEVALRAIQAARLLDPTRRISEDAGEVVIPVRPDASLPELAHKLGARLVEDPPLDAREERATPHAQVLARVPPALRTFVPEKWEKLGDVVVLRLPHAARPHAGEIAAAFADVLRAKCVVDDIGGVSGELREMDGVVLYGDDPETTHVENGIKYRLDASRIMFSSGNVAERARTIEAPAETVVDMFAGIGYFAIPLAIRGGPTRVIAIEKNPLSFRYLQENVALNRVEHVVEPWLGDNRDYAPEGIADRVLMGYLPGTAAFLPKAIALLKPRGGTIHYHDTAPAESWRETMTRAVLDASRACGRVVAVQEARVVKSYAPSIVHAIVVARVMA